jgi:spermidine synthase
LFALLSKPAETRDETSCTGLVIGLGGGSLINFWHYLLGEGVIEDSTFQPPWNVTAVELDETVVRIAGHHFGLNLKHPGFSYRIGDGLNVHPKADPVDSNDSDLGFAAGSLDFIVIDVDSKDAGAGMSCPPVAFVNQAYLQSLYALLQPNGGILAINVAARDINLFKATCQSVQSVFGKVILSKHYPGRDASNGVVTDVTLAEDNDEPEDLNVVVFAIRIETNDIDSVVPPVAEMTENVARWMQLKSSNSAEHKVSEISAIHETDSILQSELCECLEDFIACESAGSNGVSITNSCLKKKKSGNNKSRSSRRKKR